MKLRLRPVLFFVGVTILGIIIITRMGQLQSFVETLRSIHWWVLLLIIPLRYCYYWANTLYFKRFFAIFGVQFESKQLFRTVVATNFVNIVLPSAGISGLSYMSKALGKNARSSVLSLAHIAYYGLGVVAGLSLFILSFIALLLSNQVVRVSSRLVLLGMFLVLCAVVVGIVMFANRSLSVETILFGLRPINWVLHKVKRPVVTRQRVETFFDEAGDNLAFLRTHWLRLRHPFIALVVMLITDILSVYLVCLSFNQILNPAVVVSVFCLAQLGSLASVFTAGIGAFEAVMTATFVGFGLPFEVAFSITMVYRGVTFWGFLPVGLWYYKRGLLDGN